eukprot:TRINITY_DN23506_c0_g2_i1.p1 TRINITY_DN23506_c0_g2~~TRINITY_DN23506_c0_g2_i1.p1  ORF type:complete len:809 (+),score=233.99 TRINITY_DN23506_c0_g2_i1:134-2560(+)
MVSEEAIGLEKDQAASSIGETSATPLAATAGVKPCEEAQEQSGDRAETSRSPAPEGEATRPSSSPKSQRSAKGSSKSAKTNGDASSLSTAEFAGAMVKSKHHLEVCLKILGILYGSDEALGADDRQSDGNPNGGADELYLSMVMLNSSLLKAMHVAKSFLEHCQREYPKVMPANIEGVVMEALVSMVDGILAEPPSREDTGSTVASATDELLEQEEDRSLPGEDYRRLQAECVVVAENIRAVQHAIAGDVERQADLKAECQQLCLRLQELRLSREREADEAKCTVRLDSDKIALLESVGLDVERLREDAENAPELFATQAQIETLTHEVERMYRRAMEEKKAAQEVSRRAEQTKASAVDLAAKKQALRLPLQLGEDDDDLAGALRRLQEEVRRDEEEIALLEQQEAEELRAEQAAAVAMREQELAAASREALKLAAKAAKQAEEGAARNHGGEREEKRLRQSASQGRLPPTVLLQAASNGAQSARASGSLRAAGTQGGGGMMDSRSTYGALLEDPSFTKAALRCVQNPGDAQAVKRLREATREATTNVTGRAQVRRPASLSGSAASVQTSASADGRGPAAEPTRGMPQPGTQAAASFAMTQSASQLHAAPPPARRAAQQFPLGAAPSSQQRPLSPTPVQALGGLSARSQMAQNHPHQLPRQQSPIPSQAPSSASSEKQGQQQQQRSQGQGRVRSPGALPWPLAAYTRHSVGPSSTPPPGVTMSARDATPVASVAASVGHSIGAQQLSHRQLSPPRVEAQRPPQAPSQTTSQQLPNQPKPQQPLAHSVPEQRRFASASPMRRQVASPST